MSEMKEVERRLTNQIHSLQTDVMSLRSMMGATDEQQLRERVVTEIVRQGYAPSHAVTEAQKVCKFITDGK